MNPYAPKIPCHRVIRSDRGLGGYSGRGGIKKKISLATFVIENINFSETSVQILSLISKIESLSEKK